MQIVSLADLGFERIQALDLMFFPAGRAAFLAQWIRQPGTIGLAFLQHDALSGYGVIRSCQRGYKIGPLFADSQAVAERLLVSLSSRVPVHDPIFLDVPECNPAAVQLAQRYAMTALFETARMYAGTAPAMALEHTYGITSFELG